MYSAGIFLKKADHYYNFNFHTLGIAKLVVDTSENMVEQDNDVIKLLAVLNFNENTLCIILMCLTSYVQYFWMVLDETL